MTVHLVQSSVPAGGFPVASLFSSSPARRSAPGVFRSPSASIPARRGRGSPRAPQAFRRKPSRRQTVERGWGPRERTAGRAGHFPAGAPPCLRWAASPGPRLLPSAWRPRPPTDRLLLPPLELLGRPRVCKTWPWPSPAAPLANKKREGSSERPRANLAPPALKTPGPARAFGSPAGTGAQPPLCQRATRTWDPSSGAAQRRQEPLPLAGCAPHGGLLALAQGGTGRATP